MPATPETGHTELLDLLRSTEVARRLGISPRTLRRIAEAGDLPYVQLTAQIRRYRPEDVEAYLDARRSDHSQ